MEATSFNRSTCASPPNGDPLQPNRLDESHGSAVDFDYPDGCQPAQFLTHALARCTDDLGEALVTDRDYEGLLLNHHVEQRGGQSLDHRAGDRFKLAFGVSQTPVQLLGESHRELRVFSGDVDDALGIELQEVDGADRLHIHKTCPTEQRMDADARPNADTT